MKLFFILAIALQSFASPSRQLAERLYQESDYKKALKTWEELSEEFPQNAFYALKTAELKFLLEGRPSALNFLKDFEKRNKKALPAGQIQEIAKKTLEFSRSFLSEEAQTHYLQALSKANLNEWVAARLAVTQSFALEPGNTKILNLKAEVEKILGDYSAAYETLKQLYVLDPHSNGTPERLAEFHIFHGRFKEASGILEPQSKKSGFSFRAKLALAVCFWELGKKAESEKLIEDLSQNHKVMESSQSAAVLWMLHRMETDQTKNSKKAKSLFEMFQDLSSDKDSLLIDGWDPYRLANYLESFSK